MITNRLHADIYSRFKGLFAAGKWHVVGNVTFILLFGIFSFHKALGTKLIAAQLKVRYVVSENTFKQKS